MKILSADKPHRHRPLFASILLVTCLLVGCTTAPLEVRPVSQKLDVRLDPVTKRLAATSVTEVEVMDVGEKPRRRAVVELELHPDLAVTSVTAHGATLAKHVIRLPKDRGEGRVAPATVRLVVEEPAASLRFDIDYEGELWQDVAAGEVAGQVHNFAVQAHVGEEGVYLEPSGYWYPRLKISRDAAAGRLLSDYELITDPIDGFELVAGLEAVDGDAADGRLHWKSPFPLDGLVLLGGPLERHSRVHDGITLHAVVAPGKEAVAQDILAASAEYLDRYQPLIGPYPFREFTVLEAFFSSGFAFPTCTQIAGSQLSEFKQYRRHGYLDHELLHNWWGNGVFMDPEDGNWCEALTTYLANYAGYVLDGDGEGARKQRRNYSNFLSAIEPERDKPLGTFGFADGAGRGIGYQKGAAVFHMLERKIGSDALLAGLRILTEEQMGRHIGWKVIREAMERASGHDLAAFFGDWVRSGGAPRLEMTAAEWRDGERHVLVTLEQSGTDFELDVPLRLHYGDRWVDEVVTIDGERQQVEVPCEPAGLTAIELDPDYHLFRKLKPAEIMPTSALTRRAERLVIVLPDGEVPAAYRTVADSFRRTLLGGGETPEPGYEVVERSATELVPEELAEASVLLLGSAVRSAAAQSLLARSRSPVRWDKASFHVGERHYPGAGEAVYFTVHHPDRADLGLTVYYGNSERALSNHRVLDFYPNSLLVFETPPGEIEENASLMPRANVVQRIDFEFPGRIDF
ncbi:MAG: hypothetical protein AAF560_14795 [Acidobacteriota bacterium]